MRFLHVPYEELVADQEGWSRKMLDFIGMPWDARCLDFHQCDRTVSTVSNWQVRQKINKSSVERWRNYEQFAGPLMRLMELGRVGRKQEFAPAMQLLGDFVPAGKSGFADEITLHVRSNQNACTPRSRLGACCEINRPAHGRIERGPAAGAGPVIRSLAAGSCRRCRRIACCTVRRQTRYRRPAPLHPSLADRRN